MEILNKSWKDSRELAKVGKIFLIHDLAKGSLIWLQRGLNLWKKLLELSAQRSGNFEEIQTPSLCSQKLWKKSKHLPYFKDNMFLLDGWGLKPMNCPMHFETFKIICKSLKDLPFTFREVESIFRKESSGSINPPFRNFSFSQDDYHTFIEGKDLVKQCKIFFVNMLRFYLSLDFSSVMVKLTLSPNIEAAEGNDKLNDIFAKWVSAVEPEGGAFYGPKLEFTVKDRFNRSWQCGTIQIDFLARKRFNLEIQGEEIIVIHRAIMGSFERFIGLLLESSQGQLPLLVHPDPYVILLFQDSDRKLFKHFPKEIIISGTIKVRKEVLRSKALGRKALLFFGERERKVNKVKMQINIPRTEDIYRELWIDLAEISSKRIFDEIRKFELDHLDQTEGV